jgi:hypothetical protein
MKHNTISLQVLFIVVLALFAVPVFAQEFTEGGAVKVMPSEIDSATGVTAGLTATSPFYFIDRAIEEVDILFTFNPESKITKYEALADERLAELNAVAKAGYITEAERTAELYVRHYNTLTRIALDDQLALDAETKLKIQSQLAEGAVISLQDLEAVKKMLPELAYSLSLFQGVVATNQISLIDSIAKYDPARAELFLVKALTTSTQDVVRATEILKQEGGSVSELDGAIQNYNTYSNAGVDLAQKNNTMTQLPTVITSTNNTITGALGGIRTTTSLSEYDKDQNINVAPGTLTNLPTATVSGEVKNTRDNQVYSDNAGETWQSWYIQSRGTVPSPRREN